MDTADDVFEYDIRFCPRYRDDASSHCDGTCIVWVAAWDAEAALVGASRRHRSGCLRRPAYIRQTESIYTMTVTKRLVDIDDELLAKAKEYLDTRTIKDTVNSALAACVRMESRTRLLDRLARMDGLDLEKATTMRNAWRTGKRSS